VYKSKIIYYYNYRYNNTLAGGSHMNEKQNQMAEIQNFILFGFSNFEYHKLMAFTCEMQGWGISPGVCCVYTIEDAVEVMDEDEFRWFVGVLKDFGF